MKLAFFLAIATVYAVAQRTYFSTTPAKLAAGYTHTHVSVVGKVTLAKREADGDRHLRLSDFTSTDKFIVAECLPEMQLTCPSVKVGNCVEVKGIARHDAEHKWNEVHPVEAIKVVPCARVR